ncbi:MAG TPA: hypothetical protein VHL58_03530 [Thermoanaerobaculia bacterium]|nr:hypothetical protein [Thermoanaerobaculia bacterium]
MPHELIQDRECAAHLAYLYELEGLRLLDETATLEFDRRQAQANFREALAQWRAAFFDESPPSLRGHHSALHQKMIRFGLGETFSEGLLPISFRLRACSILAGVKPEPSPYDDAALNSDKPGDLLLRAFLALPDREEALRLTTLFASPGKAVLGVHRDRDAELRVLESIATILTFEARPELEMTSEARRRLITSAREASRNHPDAEFLLHLYLLVSCSCQPGLPLAPSNEAGKSTVLPFRSRQV